MVLGLTHGGWCPRGRLAEDGRIPDRYALDETRSAKYAFRTEQNVLDSDGTLILFRQQMQGGTDLTRRIATKHNKPFLAVNLDEEEEVDHVRTWLAENTVYVLNVAGPRESSHPGIAVATEAFIRELLAG